MSAHTPGPWMVNGHAIEQELGTTVVAFMADRDNDNWENDARLIRAAPEMLEAMREFVGAWEGGARRGLDLMRALERARASAISAIAKAEGRAP